MPWTFSPTPKPSTSGCAGRCPCSTIKVAPPLPRWGPKRRTRTSAYRRTHVASLIYHTKPNLFASSERPGGHCQPTTRPRATSGSSRAKSMSHPLFTRRLISGGSTSGCVFFFALDAFHSDHASSIPSPCMPQRPLDFPLNARGKFRPSPLRFARDTRRGPDQSRIRLPSTTSCSRISTMIKKGPVITLSRRVRPSLLLSYFCILMSSRLWLYVRVVEWSWVV